MTPPNNPEETKKQFYLALAEQHTIKMLVFGSGPAIDEVYQKAQIRAAVNPIRRVIRVNDPEILTEDEHALYRQKNEATVICVLNLQGEPVDFLTLAKANIAYMEKAFSKAQKHPGK